MASNDLKKQVAKIGTRFVWEYYNRLNNDPDRLFEFFHESSFLLIGTEPTLTDSVTSLQEINKKIQAQNFKENTVSLSAVDCQEGIDGGIFILVLGIISGQQETIPRKFVQTFFLGHEINDPLHFYVQNSVFRYLTEPATNAPSEQTSSSNHVSSQPAHPTPIVHAKIPIEEPIVVEQPQQAPQPQQPVSTPKETQAVSQEPQEPAKGSGSNPPQKKATSWASIFGNSSSATEPQAQEQTPQPSTLPKNPPKKAVPQEEAPISKTDQGVASVFIKNLPPSATQKDIRDIFSKMGDIVRVTLRADKGFCFVDYKHAESVKKVMEHVASNTIEIKGQKISVEEKKGKPNFQEENRGPNKRDSINFRKN